MSTATIVRPSSTSPSPSPPSSSPTMYLLDPHKCCGPHRNHEPEVDCKRRILWRIEGVGNFCNLCYEKFMGRRGVRIDIKHIQRLSDNERDFITANGK